MGSSRGDSGETIWRQGGIATWSRRWGLRCLCWWKNSYKALFRGAWALSSRVKKSCSKIESHDMKRFYFSNICICIWLVFSGLSLADEAISDRVRTLISLGCNEHMQSGTGVFLECVTSEYKNFKNSKFYKNAPNTIGVDKDSYGLIVISCSPNKTGGIIQFFECVETRLESARGI